MSQSSITFKHHILDIIYTSLPIESLKDIPYFITFLLVFLVSLFVISSFIISLSFGYQTIRNEMFLSLSNDAGSCSRVPKTINSQFMADINGNWEGSINFEYRNAIYRGTLSNFHGNEKVFENMLQDAFDTIDFLGNISYNLDLAENLIFWMAATVNVLVDGQKHSLEFTGDPKIVFNSVYSSTGLSNEAAQCDVNPTLAYDRSVGVFTLSYPIDQYLASPVCMNILDPYHTGYNGVSPEFVISIDMQSAITAMGVNMNIIPTNKLEKVPYADDWFVANGTYYESSYYFYPRYPGMTPLQCVNTTAKSADKEDDLVCAISYGSIYAYPIFNHFGASYTEPKYCDCSSIGSIRNCSYFNLLPGLIFYDWSNTPETSYTDLVRLLSLYPTGRDINREAYNISINAVLSYTNDSIWRRNAYEFCSSLTSRGCSVLAIATFSPPLYTVSPYYFQVPYGSCNNSFTISKESQQKLLQIPPTDLTEIYFECNRSPYDSFISALGVSVGNTVMARYVAIAFVTFILFWYNRIYPLHTYTNKEREKVLQFFAFNLLLARDGRYSTDEQEKSLIKQIQSELSNRVDVKRFYKLDKFENMIELQTQSPRQDSSRSQRETEDLSSQDKAPRSFSSSSPLRSIHHSNDIILNPLSPPLNSPRVSIDRIKDNN
jgi:hypothetical protein